MENNPNRYVSKTGKIYHKTKAGNLTSVYVKKDKSELKKRGRRGLESEEEKKNNHHYSSIKNSSKNVNPEKLTDDKIKTLINLLDGLIFELKLEEKNRKK